LLTKELDKPETKIQILSEYHALVGPICIWIENFPYAYGKVSTCYELRHLSEALFRYNIHLSRSLKGLPNRATVYRLHKLIQPALKVYREEQLSEARKIVETLR